MLETMENHILRLQEKKRALLEGTLDEKGQQDYKPPRDARVGFSFRGYLGPLRNGS